MKEKKRIPTDGEPIQWKSPFAALGKITLPPTTAEQPPPTHAEPATKKHRGRVEIIKQTAHRGGKTVTMVTGFVGISQAEKERLAKASRQPVEPEEQSKRDGSRFRVTGES